MLFFELKMMTPGKENFKKIILMIALYGPN